MAKRRRRRPFHGAQFEASTLNGYLEKISSEKRAFTTLFTTMPPRRSAQAKATMSTAAVNISPGVQQPQTPKKGTKRPHSDDESEMPPAKKVKIPADGTPRRSDGTAMKVPVDYISGFHDGAGCHLSRMFLQPNYLLSFSSSLRRCKRGGLRWSV